MSKIKMQKKNKEGKWLNKIDLSFNLCYFFTLKNYENKY